MLVLSQDWTVRSGELVETARVAGRNVSAPGRATCLLAETLLRDGADPASPVRLVRSDPYIFPAPHDIGGLTLGLVSKIDFFAIKCPAMRNEIRQALGLADQGR